MKVTFLAGEIGNVTSGQSRFAMNLAAGLRAEGVDVALCGSAIHSDAERALHARGVRTENLGLRSHRIAQARLLTLGSRVGRAVATRAVGALPADWYVVLSDAVVDAIEALPSTHSVYVCNGDLALLFLSPPFYSSHGVAKRWLARGMSRYILQNAERARRYRLLLANSLFTKNFMTFLYATQFAGVVYPPVDPAAFAPELPAPGQAYALAIARNENEQGLETLRRVAARIPLRVVGGARVPGAINLGRVSDPELRHLYAGARVTISPIVSELFGYSVAESLSCGTPVLTLDSGGPSEQIEDGRNGWRVHGAETLIETAVRLVREGYDDRIRAEAVRSAARFSIPTVARSFLGYLEALGPAS